MRPNEEGIATRDLAGDGLKPPHREELRPDE
jgi:hypothetical protein